MSEWVHSADSHVYEPVDLWTSRLPEALRPSALRWQYDGRKSAAVVASKAGDEAQPFISVTRPETADGSCLEGGVEERAAALDRDGVGYEVLHPNLAMFVYNSPDPEWVHPSATAFNDYMAETYVGSDRFVPVGLIPLLDLEWSVREIERCAELGMRGVALPIFVSPYYWHEQYEPVWAAAAAARLPVTFHAATGFDEQGVGMFRQIGASGFGKTGQEGMAARTYSGVDFGLPGQRLIATLVGSGVCERYPELKFISAENSANWLASLMGVMDKAWAGSPVIGGSTLSGQEQLSKTVVKDAEMTLRNQEWEYPLKPSEYVRRQVRCTFIDDQMAIACREITGVETIMWSADYPHPESSWPQSRESVDIQFAGVSDEDRRAICGGNFAAVYGLDLSKFEDREVAVGT